jgi:NADH:ubiquinone oxidoreductase subunit 4 (subunit M)
MIVGIVGFGILSGLLGALMVLGGFGSIVLAVVAYAVFGSLGASLYAVAMAHRHPYAAGDEAQGETEPQA